MRDRFTVDASGTVVRTVVLDGVAGDLEVFDRRWASRLRAGRPPGAMPRACCLWCRSVVPVRRDGLMYPHAGILGSRRCLLWMLQGDLHLAAILVEGVLGGTPTNISVH